MHAKLEKVKQHVKDNKVTYIVGGTCLVVGALGGAAFVLTRPEAKILTKWCWKPTITKIEAETVVNGDVNLNFYSKVEPGWVTRNIETNREFASQEQAAKAFGLNSGNLSQHLNGKKEHVNGLHFERVRRATLPPEMLEEMFGKTPELTLTA